LSVEGYSHTSTLSINSFLDRDSGKPVFISSLNPKFKVDLSYWSADKMAVLAKYLLLFQALPEAAWEEAVGELEKVVEFHTDRVPQVQLPTKVTQIIGRINSIQVRPPIVLESDGKSNFEKFEQSGLIGCCDVEEDLSVNYKSVLADLLESKYDNR
jgi:hypothetical protein